MTTELRKWAIEQAVLAKSKNVLKDAAAYLEWTQDGDTLIRKAKQQEQDERGEVTKEWAAKALTDAKKRVMMNVISRYNRELPVNGSQVAADLKMTQSNASHHLSVLVEMGYVARQGNKFWPLRTITGKLMPVIVHKMPKGVAKGYTGQATATLGEIASIK